MRWRNSTGLSLLIAGSAAFGLYQDTPAFEPDSSNDVITEPTRAPSARNSDLIGDADLQEAMQAARTGRYSEGSARLFQLSFSPRFLNRRMEIKYILGLTLQRMDLPQLAAFQFMTIVKEADSNYAAKALERLAMVADRLNDESLLNYAYSKIKIDSFPTSQKDRLYLRIAEFEQRHGQFAQAAATYGRVPRGSRHYFTAKYQQGLSYAEGNKLQEALAAFDELIESRKNAAPNDGLRAAGYMGKARVLYQMKDWDRAIATYRMVPRDTWPWHDTLFEGSWAMMRSGRFRSALSNFHSLHSAFYENTYLPESLILRSIVYLYICKYEETEKVLNLFAKMYKPAYQALDVNLRDNKNPAEYFNIIYRIANDFKRDPDGTPKRVYPIPYVVAQKVSQESNVRRSFAYVKNLMSEKARMDALPAGWRASVLGQYARKVIDTRIAKARQHSGRQIRTHLVAIHNELLDLIEQSEFIRFEILNGQKEQLKKRIAGKQIKSAPIDVARERDYYVQNGYEYWPFRGEYWLNELGNYHYVGTQSCN